MKNPNKKEDPPSEHSSAVEEFLYPNRLQKIIARRKNLVQKKTIKRRIFPLSEENQPEAVDPSENASDTGDTGRSLQKIKMEITFSDESKLEKEIILTDKNAAEQKVIIFDDEPKKSNQPADGKIPIVTVVVLAVIICASLITGIYHWYTAYLQPDDTKPPEFTEARPGDVPDVNPTPTDNITIDDPTEEADPEPPVIQRPQIDPFPEFILLWEEYGNDDIVAVLTVAEEEFIVVQSSDNAFYITHDIHQNYSSSGWVFLDYQVDLLLGMEHNMVVYDPIGGIMRDVIHEFADYDHFLMHPTISFSTLYGDFDWEIFAFYVAPSDFPFAVVNHSTDETWGEMVEQFTMASLYNTMLDVTMYDQVLTIAVPTNIDPELFYILQARMLRQITS